MSMKMAAIDLALCIIIAVLHLLGVPLISNNIGTIIFGTFIIRFVIDMFFMKEKGFQSKQKMGEAGSKGQAKNA